MAAEEQIRLGRAGRPAPPVPRCPQFRTVRAAGAYPVTGYCALAAAPGQRMIPSTEEFRTGCTTLHFRQCPWFGGSPGASDPGARLPDSPTALRDVWACPEVTASRTGA